MNHHSSSITLVKASSLKLRDFIFCRYAYFNISLSVLYSLKDFSSCRIAMISASNFATEIVRIFLFYHINLWIPSFDAKLYLSLSAPRWAESLSAIRRGHLNKDHEIQNSKYGLHPFVLVLLPSFSWNFRSGQYCCTEPHLYP